MPWPSGGRYVGDDDDGGDEVGEDLSASRRAVNPRPAPSPAPGVHDDAWKRFSAIRRR